MQQGAVPVIQLICRLCLADLQAIGHDSINDRHTLLSR